MTTTEIFEPPQIKRLPKNKAGYRVPWFVSYVDGEPDFRIVRSHGIDTAHLQRLCWICGTSMSAYKTFVVGPMCVVNRVSSEPPMHHACAIYSVQACPFLTRSEHAPARDRHPRRRAHRRRDGRPQPCATAVWTTKKYTVEVVPASYRNGDAHPGGVLFNIGEPHKIEWKAEGRDATREEVMHSLETGLPLLLEAAERDGPRGVENLNLMVQEALCLVPA